MLNKYLVDYDETNGINACFNHNESYDRGGSAQKTSFAFRLVNDKYHCCEKLNRNEFKGAGWLWSNSDSVIFQSSLQRYRKNKIILKLLNIWFFFFPRLYFMTNNIISKILRLIWWIISWTPSLLKNITWLMT